MKDCHNLSYLKYSDINNFDGWTMSQNFLLGNFKGVEETSEFNKDFITSYNDDSYERYFLEVDVQYHEHLHNFHNNLPFLPERIKTGKAEKLVAN